MSMRTHTQKRRAVFILLVMLAGVQVFCAVQPRSTPTPLPTATLTPTVNIHRPTRTPQPIGHEDNPLVIAFVDGDDNALVRENAEVTGARLAELTGLAAEGVVYPTYKRLFADMERGLVHLAWMPPLTYLYASGLGYAQALLVTNQFGVDAYGVQFLANVDSGFTPYFDPAQSSSTAPAALALGQFDGLRPCWVDPDSLSGYIVPAGLLALNDIQTLDAVQSQTAPAVIRSLYIKNICDFGATFAISGDPRTSSTLQDLPDVMERVEVIWRSEPIIPNLALAGLPELDPEIQQNVILALQEMFRTEEGKNMLLISTGVEFQALREINDSFYQPLREIVQASGVNLEPLVGK